MSLVLQLMPEEVEVSAFALVWETTPVSIRPVISPPTMVTKATSRSRTLALERRDLDINWSHFLK
jgi:hypothetical protein